MQVPSRHLTVSRLILAGDLHLKGVPAERAPLARLLELARAQDATLIFLGDLFHYWLGPRHLHEPMYREALALLRSATAGGLSIRVLPGNRDFLLDLDSSFSGATGVTVDGDSLSIQVGPTRVHLSHGDLFCTADVRYQRMRRILRSRMVRFWAGRLPAWLVKQIAARLRGHSERVVRAKPAGMLEPDRELVKSLLRQGFHDVICGHFHVVRDEAFPVAEGGGHFRIVEPFEEQGYVLEHDGAGWLERRLGVREDP